MRGQGRIFKRGATWWIAYSRNGKEYRESAKSTKEADATRLLKKRWREIHGGRFVGPTQERVMFSQLLDDLETHYKLNGRRSLRTLQTVAKHIRAAFGMDRAIDVTKNRLEKYKADRIEAKAAPASVNRELAVIGKAFSLALDRDLLSVIPRVKKLKEDNARQGFVGRSDLLALLKELPDYLADFTRFAYLTGWRRGEVASLLWGDIDFQGRTVTLPGERSKNGEARVIPLEGDLLALLERRYVERFYTPKKGEPRIVAHVFHRRGKPVGDFRKSWDPATEKTGLSGLIFHDLRRAAVMNMRRAGVSEGVIMQFTGHKTRSVFERYNIKTLDDMREAQARTQSYLEGQPVERKVESLPVTDRKRA